MCKVAKILMLHLTYTFGLRDQLHTYITTTEQSIQWIHRLYDVTATMLCDIRYHNDDDDVNTVIQTD